MNRKDFEMHMRLIHRFCRVDKKGSYFLGCLPILLWTPKCFRQLWYIFNGAGTAQKWTNLNLQSSLNFRTLTHRLFVTYNFQKREIVNSNCQSSNIEKEKKKKKK